MTTRRTNGFIHQIGTMASIGPRSAEEEDDGPQHHEGDEHHLPFRGMRLLARRDEPEVEPLDALPLRASLDERFNSATREESSGELSQASRCSVVSQRGRKTQWGLSGVGYWSEPPRNPGNLLIASSEPWIHSSYAASLPGATRRDTTTVTGVWPRVFSSIRRSSAQGAPRMLWPALLPRG